MIHRLHTYCCRLFALLCIGCGLGCGSLQAQHFVGFEMAGHVPFTIDNISITRPRIGYGGEVGLVYELHHNHFLFMTGVQYNLLCPTMAVDNEQLEQAMIDTRGVRFIYRGSLDNRVDGMCSGQVAVPLYVGGTWSGFYVMAGVKAGVNLHGKAFQKAQLKTAGDYQDRYYEWFENMPNHGYHDYQQVKSSHVMKLNMLDLRACAEIGYTVNTKRVYERELPPILRIGLFAECGIMNMHNTKDNSMPRTQPDYSQYMSVQMTHVYASREVVSKSTHLVTCGLRLTFLFPVASNPNAHPCRCLYGRWW